MRRGEGGMGCVSEDVVEHPVVTYKPMHVPVFVCDIVDVTVIDARVVI